MHKLEEINNAINSINDLPEFFKLIQKDVLTNTTRLHYLLYGKDNKYEGPLYNDLQKNEWAMLTLLISNWLIETIHLIQPSIYKTNALLLLDSNLPLVASKIIIAFIENDVIPMSNEDKLIVITFLQNQYLINFLHTQIETVLSKIRAKCGCFPPKHNTFVEISNDTGNKCTFINSIPSKP